MNYMNSRMKILSIVQVILLAVPILLATPARGAADQGWTHLQTIDPSSYLKVYFKVEGGQLKVKWVNANPCQGVDIRYQAKWEEKVAGRWEEKSTAWGAGVHVNKDSENHTFSSVQLDKENVRSVRANVIDHKWGERSRERGCQ